MSTETLHTSQACTDASACAASPQYNTAYTYSVQNIIFHVYKHSISVHVMTAYVYAVLHGGFA
jgi:hypothetical protein